MRVLGARSPVVHLWRTIPPALSEVSGMSWPSGRQGVLQKSKQPRGLAPTSLADYSRLQEGNLVTVRFH